MMKLDVRLRDVVLSFPCPKCGCLREGRGSWFSAVTGYRCAACDEDVRITYEQKLSLFAANIDLLPGEAGKRRPKPEQRRSMISEGPQKQAARLNIEHIHQRLETETDGTKRGVLLRRLAEEKAKLAALTKPEKGRSSG